MSKKTYTALYPAPTPYQLRTNSPKQKHQAKNKKIRASLAPIYDRIDISKLSVYAAVTFKLQYIYGLRHADVRRIRNCDVLPCALIRILGSKMSTERIIYMPDILPLVNNNPVHADLPVIRMTYRQYYLQLTRAGYCVKLNAQSKHNTVTHISRHIRFESLRQAYDLDLTKLRAFSGHSSAAGLNYYLGSNSLCYNKN